MTSAQLFFWGARALYLGPAFGLSPHRNAVAVLCAGMTADFELAADAPTATQRYRTCRIALIAPNSLHQLRAQAEPMSFLYVDAQSEDYGRLCARERLMGPGSGEEAAYLTGLAGLHAGEPWRQARERIASALDLPVPGRTDERIAEVVRHLHKHPGDPNDLDHFASSVRLSPSRFLHRFKDATGVPFRRYRLWARMGGAVRNLVRGASLTEASLDAGFSSSAHFSAAFRDMFGMAPSLLVKYRLSIIEGGEGNSQAAAVLPIASS